MELSAKNQSPLYEQIHEYEAVAHIKPAKAQQPLPPQPSGNYQLTTCPAYVPNTAATAQSSGGAEGDGEYAIPRDEVSGVVGRNAEQYENMMTAGDGDGVTVGAKESGEGQYEAVGADGAA